MSLVLSVENKAGSLGASFKIGKLARLQPMCLEFSLDDVADNLSSAQPTPVCPESSPQHPVYLDFAQTHPHHKPD